MPSIPRSSLLIRLRTGPEAILFDPDASGRGLYTARVAIHLFDAAGEESPFGLFVGGADLDGDRRTYTSFTIRPSGEYRIRRRTSRRAVETLVDWTDHDAVVSWEDRGEGEATASNTLAIGVGSEEMAFLVNGTVVATVPRRMEGAEGIAGLWVGAGLDLHVVAFQVGD